MVVPPKEKNLSKTCFLFEILFLDNLFVNLLQKSKFKYHIYFSSNFRFDICMFHQILSNSFRFSEYFFHSFPFNYKILDCKIIVEVIIFRNSLL